MNVAPGATFEATYEGDTGLTGTLGRRIMDGQGNTTTARFTTGIVETPASSGIYVGTQTAPSTAGQYVLVWDDGVSFASEDLTVTYSTGTSTPAGDSWITVDDLALYLHRDLSGDSDSANLAIDIACDTIRTLTEQTITQVLGGTATLDGSGTDALILPELPVTNAGTVIESGGTLTLTDDYVLAENGTLFRKPGVIDNGWGTEELRTYWWPGRQNVVVTYDYGYADGEVPNDLRGLALSMAGRAYLQSSNVEFESIGQRQIRYASSAGELPFTERTIIRKYRR